jgi:hypothetical protein
VAKFWAYSVAGYVTEVTVKWGAPLWVRAAAATRTNRVATTTALWGRGRMAHCPLTRHNCTRENYHLVPTAASAERIAQCAAEFPPAVHLAHKAGLHVLEMLAKSQAQLRSRLAS